MQKTFINLDIKLNKCYTDIPNNPDSKCNWVMDSPSKGWKGSEDHSGFYF